MCKKEKSFSGPNEERSRPSERPDKCVPIMVRYPFGLLRAVSQVEPLTRIGNFVRLEVYPPSAAPEATRVSKDA
jgi:hypothetical protein